MRKFSLRLVSALCGFAVGLALTQLVARTPRTAAVTEVDPELFPHSLRTEQPQGAVEIDDNDRLRDAFVEEEQLAYNGYVVSRLHQSVTLDYPHEFKPSARQIDVSYAVVTQKNREVAKFDAGYYGGYGNSTRFGLFAFLGRPIKQLVVSQDVSRGGTQWVVSLVPRFHVIFDGQYWGVGRETDDMRVEDLDQDGVLEILVPITDFYDLQDKMSISEIPLPTVIFKYNEKAERYLPANKMFREYALHNVEGYNQGIDSSDELFARSRILRILLDEVYAGEREKGWAFFEINYKLADKEELRKRIKSLLRDQPVYRFIYHEG